MKKRKKSFTILRCLVNEVHIVSVRVRERVDENIFLCFTRFTTQLRVRGVEQEN